MSFPPAPATVTLAFTGASGLPIGLRLLECLIVARCRVRLVVSPAARCVAEEEAGLRFPEAPDDMARFFRERCHPAGDQLRVFGHQDWRSPIASGSNCSDAMVVCPCSMGTLAAVAGGLSDNLIERAADVCLKERRPLVLVPRETPLSAIHLENMLKLARLGVVILPPVPGFYHRPQTASDLVDFIVARILDTLAIPYRLLPRWGDETARPEKTAQRC